MTSPPDTTGTPELNKALAAFQASLPAIAKSGTGEVKGTTRDGKPYSYTYQYAPLEDVSDAVMPGLGKQGLAFTATPGTDAQGRLVMDYALTHASGEERAGQFPLWLLLPDRFTAQTIGGYITYARRYVLCAVTGVAPGGEDNDAQAGEPATAGGGRWMNRRPDVPPKDLQDKRTPTRTTGTEQEQLRQGTVEATPDDRPAHRARGQANGDPWQDQPPGDFQPAPTSLPTRRAKPHTPAQLIAAHWKRLGITDDEERHNWTARMAGVPELASTNELDTSRQEHILEALAHCKDIGQVQDWIDTQAGVP